MATQSIVKHSKVVGALPATLEQDTLYAVRARDGFDLYLSDMTGAIAHKVNDPVVLVRRTLPQVVSGNTVSVYTGISQTANPQDADAVWRVFRQQWNINTGQPITSVLSSGTAFDKALTAYSTLTYS